MWKIWWAPNNASKWQIGFNPAFEGLKVNTIVFWLIDTFYDFVLNKHSGDDSPQNYAL